MSDTPAIEVPTSVQEKVNQISAKVAEINELASALAHESVSVTFNVFERSTIGMPNREMIEAVFTNVITPTRFERRG